MAGITTRVGAYAWIEDGGRVLLTHWVGSTRGGSEPAWTLPGGGMEPGETVEETVLREVREETGFDVAIDGILGTDTIYAGPFESEGADEVYRGVRIIHRAHIVGGTLGVLEVGGSTDDVRWFEIAKLAAVPRVGLVDAARAVAS